MSGQPGVPEGNDVGDGEEHGSAAGRPATAAAAGLAADAREGMFMGLLWATHLCPPDRLPTEVAAQAAAAGLRDATMYLVDLEQEHLVPLPVAGGEPREVVRIEGSMAGRCFALGQIVTVDLGVPGRRHLWVPLVDGTERLGVMSFDVDATGGGVDPALQATCERYAHLASQVMVSKGAYGDALEQARRREAVSVAAELQRAILPPLTAATERLVIAGMTEPCYRAGGDSFDYAISDKRADVAIFDAMGHGLAAAATASVAVAAYRSGRRRGLSLLEAYAQIDATLGELFDGDAFASAVLAELDLATGVFRWVNAGHPPPLLIRGGKLVKVLDAPPATALGMPVGEPPGPVAHEGLEPGDRILLYTDGVTEARTPDGEQFSAERLATFIERQSDPGVSAPETLRRLRHAIMAHQRGRLQDDATVVLCEWHGGSQASLLPKLA